MLRLRQHQIDISEIANRIIAGASSVKTVDPGWGDPNAPVGTVEWAKRWRCSFQSVVKNLPFSVETNRQIYDIGKAHRAWSLVTDGQGRPFRTFEEFCSCAQPYGLGADPVKFLAHLKAEEGAKAVDLATVAPGDDKGGRPKKGEETGAPGAPVSEGMCPRKQKNLRAILRAPEIVQQLYRDNLLTQKDAALMGPSSPSVSLAGFVVEARDELGELDRSLPATDFRKKAGEVIRRRLGARAPTPFERVRRLLPLLSDEERMQLARLCQAPP